MLLPHAVQVDDQGVHFGACVTLSRLMDSCKQLSASLPQYQVRVMALSVSQRVLFGCILLQAAEGRPAAAPGGKIGQVWAVS